MTVRTCWDIERAARRKTSPFLGFAAYTFCPAQGKAFIRNRGVHAVWAPAKIFNFSAEGAEAILHV
jgi:hypothetical protein